MKTKFAIARRIMVFLILSVALFYCKKEFEADKMAVTNQEQFLTTVMRNPSPDEIGVIPPATVELLKFPEVKELKGAFDVVPASLMPETIVATLRPGESAVETKTASISSAPPKGDILFMMDLTSSMGEELNNVKTNSINIMNSIGSVIADAAFGLVTHMDYTTYYNYICGYYSTYPYGSSTDGDYPYQLDQSITSVKSDVATRIYSKSLGNGLDLPEDYARVLYETTADPSIGWRPGARKFVVAWLDALPHDCARGPSTGVDPGRDGIAGTDDDLGMAEVLATMDAQNITLIVLYSGSGYLSVWKGYAALTGGDAFQISPDGTIPSGTDIDAYIANIILTETSKINNLTLEVCTPGYEGWLTTVDPASYTDVDLAIPFTGDFEVTYTVPEGTEAGVNEFDVCLIGDGAEYARQHVTITVATTIQVALDIQPTGCPNPINRGSNGIVPAAILGFEGFDVTNIDPSTIRLEGIAPVKWSLEDVAGLYYPFKDKVIDKMSCNTSGPDGFADLTLKFDNRAVSALLAGYQRGDLVKLHVTGELLDGTLIEGEDIIIIVK